MRYFIAIFIPEDNKTSFGVAVPDLPGCFSAGDTLDEAIANAEEVMVTHLEDIIERGNDLPVPSSPVDLKQGDYDECVFVGVEINPKMLSSKAKRINVTIPEGILYLIDREAEKKHINRSAFLAEAALAKIQGG